MGEPTDEVIFEAERMRGRGPIAVTHQRLRIRVTEFAIELDQETDIIIIPRELWSDINAAIRTMTGN